MAIPIITLTTDLGLKDYYVPSAKGYIISHLPSANIIDITHEIRPFRIDEASYILKGCFENFPSGTIHIVSVDTSTGQNTRFIAVRAKGQYFLCHDNGLISLIVEENDIDEVIDLPFVKNALIFPLKNIFAPAALKIFETGDISALGTIVTDFVRKANIRPLIEESIIRGTVIHIDNIGNAITNIDKQSFGRFSTDRNYRINFSRTDYFDVISAHYNEVPEGEKVCLFNSTGLLEIAINKGSCSNLLGIRPGHSILIEFL